MVTDVQLPVGNDRVRPSRRLCAIRLIEATAFHQLFTVGLDQQYRSLFGAQVESAIGESQ
jgi:hypothetical protein